MKSAANKRTHEPSTSSPAPDESSLGRELQWALICGWEAFIKSDKQRALRGFALFLDRGAPVPSDRRMRLPHPAYDVAALYIGIPFMEVLRARGLTLDSWFPGDV